MPDGGLRPAAPSPLGPRLAGPAMATGAMLVVLVGLGVWQVQRLAWKEGLLAQIARTSAAAPIPLPDSAVLFQRVQVSGRLEAGRLLFGAEVRDMPAGPVLGEQLVVPLLRADGPPVLVDLGWVPDKAAVAIPGGVVTVTGFVRPPERPGWLSATDDPKGRRFYTLDPPAMAAALGLPRVAPLTLVATAPPAGGTPMPGIAPAPVGAPPELPNNHLSYALTWFGLAGTLVVVFGVWARRVILDA